MRHRAAILLLDAQPFASELVAPQLEGGGGNSVGDIGEIPLPSTSDMGFIDRVMSRSESDPHVDIVVMYRKRCGHCKPEIARVYKYLTDNPGAHVSAYAIEVDQDSNVDWLKSQLLGEEEATPSTGYWAHGKLQLSSPSRKESVAHWVDVARAAKSLGCDKVRANYAKHRSPRHPQKRRRIVHDVQQKRLLSDDPILRRRLGNHLGRGADGRVHSRADPVARHDPRRPGDGHAAEGVSA